MDWLEGATTPEERRQKEFESQWREYESNRLAIQSIVRRFAEEWGGIITTLLEDMGNKYKPWQSKHPSWKINPEVSYDGSGKWEVRPNPVQLRPWFGPSYKPDTKYFDQGFYRNYCWIVSYVATSQSLTGEHGNGNLGTDGNGIMTISAAQLNYSQLCSFARQMYEQGPCHNDKNAGQLAGDGE